MHTDPAGHGHGKLEKCIDACDEAHALLPHLRFMESVGEGDGKGIHRQTDPESRAVHDK